MAPAALSDEVVTAAQTGDRDALRELYLVLSPAVIGYLRVKGAEDPEGLTSEVFLALLPQLPKAHGGAAGIRKLTFSIAHARMVDDHRARARRPQSVAFDAGLDFRSTGSAEELAQVNLATERVRAVLDELPEDQRDVLSLRIVADLSIDQVAAILGRSAGAIKQLQRRGLIAVRRALAERQVTQ